MANGRILRGEVYWVSVDDSVGSEIQTGRPAVVISGNKANELLPTVIIAYITSQGKPSPSNVSIRFNGEPRRVLCNQLRTIDKQRLTRYELTLDEPEMIRVTGALACSMCIPLATAMKKESVEDPEKTALKAECDMWKRLYNVTMDQLVEIKMTSELALRMGAYEDVPELEPVEEPEPVVEESEPEQPKVEFEPEPELTDINTCSYADLKHLGFAMNIAMAIIEGRPYKSIHDLRKLNGMTSIMYQLVEKKICCNPVVEEEPVVEEPVVEIPVEEPVEEPVVEPLEEKVNINTVKAKELIEKLGMPACDAYSITGYRNKNGRFVALEELLEVKMITPWKFNKYKDRITIGEDDDAEESNPVVSEPVPEETTMREDAFGGKLNVNTATVEEICAATGMGVQTAQAIVWYRNKNGPFTELTDLLNIQRFGKGCMKTYGDMLTVGEPEDGEEEPEQESGKVNINQANIYDLMKVGFEKRAAALIVNERKKYGNYRSVDDLSEIDEISGKILRKLRDKLEV